MKIVVNSCFGGFSLSPAGVQKYAKLSGFKIFGYQQDYSEGYDRDRIIRYKTGDRDFRVYWLKEDLGDTPTNKELNKAEWFNDRDIERNDPILVKVVEELGEESFGSHAKLKIVEIPDDVKWHISDYDGMEHVAENHRTW